MSRLGVVLVVCALVVLSVAAAPGSAAVVNPRFEASTPDPLVTPGEETTVTVQLVNDAADPDDTAETARQVRATMQAGDTPFSIESGTILAGDMPDGVFRTLEFSITVPRNASAGVYDVPITLTYEYASNDGEQTITVPIRVEAVARFRAVDAETTASIGDTGTLTLQLRNIGDEAATDARVVVRSSDSELTFGSGGQSADGFVGRWAPGETKQVQFKMQLGDDAIRRNYSIETVVEFLDDAGQSRQDTVYVGVRPQPRQSFSIVDQQTAAPIGGAGQLTLAIENTGPQPLFDSTVTVASQDADVTFAQGERESQTFTGEWAVGEVKTLTYRVSVSDTAVRRNYSLRATVAFEDEFGNERTPRTLITAFRPAPEQAFEIRDVQTDLSIGATGTIDATVVNTGESAVRDAVVVLQAGGTNLDPQAVEYPVGTLQSGQGAPVRFTLDVPATATPGARRLAFVVRYDNAAGDTLESEPLGVQVNVSERQPAFTLEPATTEFTVDSEGRLLVDLTNDRAERVTDITATMSVVDPLDSEDTEAFVSSLDPGETARLSFHLDVSSDAVPKTHSIQVDLSYRDAAGTLREEGPYRIGIEVVPESGPPFPVVPAVAVGLAVVLGAVWWYRRR